MTTERPETVPDLDWSPERARELGEGVLDVWTEWLGRLRDLPVARTDTAGEVGAGVAIDIPDEPLPTADLLGYLRRLTFEHSMYPGHPGFVAYVSGAGTVPGAAADLLAAGLNQNVGGWRLSPGATEIERRLTRWFADRFGFPDTAGGLMTSGGAMASFAALKAARDLTAGGDVRREGIRGGPPLTMYGSTEVHTVNARAADMLGLGTSAFRQIPTDGDYRMRVDLLREAIERDLASGARPVAVVGSAGTVATGAIDPLDDLADVCAEHGLWLHLDGAYGAVASWVDDLRPLFRGIERADSIAFDPHKWLYTPHSGGALVVRDARHLSDAFSVHPSYVREDKELTGRGEDFLNHGPQFSRGFQALKVWVSLLAHGWNAYARRIAHDARLAAYLHERAAAHPDFEVVAPQSLSIACFRYVPPDLRTDAKDRGNEVVQAYMDALNERLMAAVQMDGRVYPSNAVLDGRFVLRACIVNFRTEAEDMDALLEVTSRLGARIDEEMRPEELRPGRRAEA
ncbi:MAG: pyridoxal phosphate-dependent decarboxylase family protein [Gemmatimonadota bacterium]